VPVDAAGVSVYAPPPVPLLAAGRETAPETTPAADWARVGGAAEIEGFPKPELVVLVVASADGLRTDPAVPIRLVLVGFGAAVVAGFCTTGVGTLDVVGAVAVFVDVDVGGGDAMPVGIAAPPR
jgi:hypothetical protein